MAGWERTGPINGLPSGANVNGPLIVWRIPISLKIGKCEKPTSRLSAMRSRSGVSSCASKSHGVVFVDQGTPPFS
jgi:hypothetical protein